ncbi:hypothetical protein BGW39_007343 [Mortierella sp. 14UC]|nr:hypothetical protein BGW39_007343 [Mortierella sp. 14UC]
MARKIVRHSILAALVLIAACSAVPSPFIASPDLASVDPLNGTIDPLGTGSYTTDLLSSPADAFRTNLGLAGSDLGLNASIDPIASATAMGDFSDPTAALFGGPTSALLSGDVAGGGGGGVLDSLVPPTQVVPSQRVHLASETKVTPTTGVFPNLIFQPAIQLYDPLVNNFQTYGVGPAYTNGYAGGSGLGVASFKKRQLAGGPVGLSGPSGLSGGPAGGAFGPGPIGGAIGGSMGTPPVIVNGAPTNVATDTLIQPIVNIQPHALQPVPVPISAPYDYPVPVGVSVPVGPVGPVGSIGGWGGNDCDWGKWGGRRHGGKDCDDDWSWGNNWGGGWGDDCDWGWGNGCNW